MSCVAGLATQTRLSLTVIPRSKTIPPTTPGLASALVVDLDADIGGAAGVLVPQTDTSSASFVGNCAFGAQAFVPQATATSGWEFDFIGQGAVYESGQGNVLLGMGYVSDPFDILSGSGEDTGVTFAGTASSTTAGRYTMFPPSLFLIELSATSTSYSVAVYQASGGQLFCMAENLSDTTFTSFSGPLELQGSLTGLPTGGGGAAVAKPKQ